VPVVAPHAASVALHVAVNAVGSVIVDVHIAVQPFPSVTVAVYVPADRPVNDDVTAPVDHEYVYGAVPPLAVILEVPSPPKLQLTLVPEQVAVSTVGWVTM
jgi:hypothetical protein